MTREYFLKILKGSEYFKYLDQCRLKRNTEDEQVEIHHIYPKSFTDGKIDSDDNLIKLTRPEHLKAHLLLVLSLEQLGETGRCYRKAIKAVNILYLVNWTKMTNEDKSQLIDNLEKISQLCWKSLHDPRPEDVVEKIKNSWTPERRQELSIRMRLREVSPETRKKMGEANRRRKVAPMQGKTQSLETRKAISEALKLYKRTPEHCKHISESKQGSTHAPHSSQTRLKMSQAAKGRIVVWKSGIKTYCRPDELEKYTNSGYFLTKKESL